MFYKPQQVDRDGVLSLVQDIKYIYSGYWLDVTFFNGKTLRFDASFVNDLCISSTTLSRHAYNEAEQWLINNQDIYWEDIRCQVDYQEVSRHTYCLGERLSPRT